MKKVILFLSFIMLTVNVACAATISPQILTHKESRDYKKINSASVQAFQDVLPKIETTAYSPIYKNYRVMMPERTQSSKFYYVKSGPAELLYDRETKALKYVTFRKPFLPRTWVVYNYPSGNLRQVDVWLYLNEVYSFNSDGDYINYKAFKKAVDETVKANLNIAKKDRLKYTAKGQNRPGVVVLLTIDHSGVIQQCKALQQSKSEAYNNSIYEAIWKSSPFSKIPYPFTTSTMDVELEF